MKNSLQEESVNEPLPNPVFNSEDIELIDHTIAHKEVEHVETNEHVVETDPEIDEGNLVPNLVCAQIEEKEPH